MIELTEEGPIRVRHEPFVPQTANLLILWIPELHLICHAWVHGNTSAPSVRHQGHPSICISGTAYDQTRSTFEVGYEALCTFQVARCAPPDYMALEWRPFFRCLTSLEALICRL